MYDRRGVTVSNQYSARKDKVEARLNAAPLRSERENFLSHLRKQGTPEDHVRILATRIVEINRLLDMTAVRVVDATELDRAIEKGMDRLRADPVRKVAPSSAQTLRVTARRWLRFNNCLAVMDKPKPPFNGILFEFLSYIEATRGPQSSSINTSQGQLSHFMEWAAHRRSQLSDVSLNDIDDWIRSKRQAGVQPRSIQSYCCSLRAFYRWANVEGWTEQKIALGIKSPRIPKADRTPKGPLWADVRRLIDSITGSSRSALRFKVIVLLSSIYGLRNVEVRRLTLDDFNWESAIMTVRRAKGGRLQQFPIQYEVGEAILQYLQHGRPKSRSRTLLLSIRAPFREMHGCLLPAMIRDRLKSLNIESQYRGVHALRHACATELLHQGSCLTDIAGFLGHKTLTSVGIYAKLDESSLRMVADFSLGGLL